MENKFIKQLLEYCAILENDKLTEVGDCISLRAKGGIYITDANKAMKDMTADDVKFITEGANDIEKLHFAIYKAKEGTNAIIMNHATYCVGVAKKCKKLYAVLDDMAQIIGRTAKVAMSYDESVVVKTLKGRDACLIKNGGVIATGRTLDEAHTGSLVLEKGAKAYVEATILGKAVKIGILDAFIMRTVYKLKYSKKDQSAKLAEMEE